MAGASDCFLFSFRFHEIQFFYDQFDDIDVLLLFIDVGTRNQMAIDTDLVAFGAILFNQICGCSPKHDRYEIRLWLAFIRFP